jgi:ABC-type sulfate transport system substrate-binding protein
MHTTAPDLLLSGVEADRLIVALDHHVDVDELNTARRVVHAARTGRLRCNADVAAVVRRCLAREGNAPGLLARLP